VGFCRARRDDDAEATRTPYPLEMLESEETPGTPATQRRAAARAPPPCAEDFFQKLP